MSELRCHVKASIVNDDLPEMSFLPKIGIMMTWFVRFAKVAFKWDIGPIVNQDLLNFENDICESWIQNIAWWY